MDFAELAGAVARSLTTHRHEAAEVSLRFEAAVAGGIPVLKAIGEGLAANEISRVFGVLNGTCNYILSEMEATEADYADVLADAQRLGYAEADPSFDVGGTDAAHKLAILAALAFGTRIDFDGVVTEPCAWRIAVDFKRMGSIQLDYLDDQHIQNHAPKLLN